MLGILLLALSAALMGLAVLRRMESALLAAVIAYAGTVVYLIKLDPRLLPAALLAALAIAAFAGLRGLFGRPRVPDESDAALFPDGG